MNFITVNKLFCNNDSACYSEGKDFSFLKPNHIVSIESLQREVLTYDEDLGYKIPKTIFVYRITLIENNIILCTVEDREILYNQITGLDYLGKPV